MNKIYKVIWSKAKGCYVVVSELAKNVESGTSRSRVKLAARILTCLLAAGYLTVGLGWSAYAAGSIEVIGLKNEGNDHILVGASHTNTSNIDTVLFSYGTPGNVDDGTSPESGRYSKYIFYGTSLGNNTSIADESGLYNGIAIGDYATATGGVAAAIGLDAHATGQASMAIGIATKAEGFNSLALMRQSYAKGDFSSAIGTSSIATGNNSVAMGSSALAGGARSIAIGAANMGAIENGKETTTKYDSESNTQALGLRSIAIGAKARTGVNATDALALGSGAAVSNVNSMAIGNGATSDAKNSLALGTGTQIGVITSNTTAAFTGTQNKDIDNGVVAVGNAASTRRILGVAGGVNDTDAVNVSQLKAVADKDIYTVSGALNGTNEVFTRTDGTTYTVDLSSLTSGLTNKGLKFKGDDTNVISKKLDETMVIKGGASTTELTDNNIGVVAKDGALNVKLAKNLKGLSSTEYVDANGKVTTTVDSTGIKVENGDHDVSLTKNGLSNGDNKITNVAAGTADTDAVNVSQLKAAAAGAANKVADGVNTTVTSESNKDGSTTYHVNLNPKITLGNDPDKQVTVDGTTGTIKTGKVSIDGTTGTMKAGLLTVNGTEGTVNGLTNKTWVVGTTTPVSGRAATEDQLKAVSDVAEAASKSHTTIDNKDKNITIKTTDTNGQLNYTVGLSDNINIGGNEGKDGSINVADKDGKKGVTISTTSGQGSIKLTGANSATADIIAKSGAADVAGNAMDRVAYTDHNSVTHETATMDDGLTYKGDAGSAAVKLNKQVSVVGETTQGKTLTTGNIGVEAVQDGDNAKLVVKLADNLTGIKNIETETLNATTVNSTTIKAGDTVTINNTGINMGDTKVTNLKAGDLTATSTDAVNGSQLYQTNTNLDKLGSTVSDLDNRVDKVGAGAAALAALHPLDFDPDDKWDFATGYGNYGGANAVAVGAFYRPDEDTMFSIGGAVGNGENMINAGISIKVGSHKNHVSTSRVAVVKEVKDLRKEVEELRGLLAGAYLGKKLDPAKLKLFPDIPENHWAYEAIKQLAGNGIVEGYPDGSFKGDRLMTRYEFAMIVYRAMQDGANVKSKLVKEFTPELERIKVDVISKDKNGKPDIERVRVIPGRC